MSIWAFIDGNRCTDTSTFIGLHGEIANQVMGSSAGFERYQQAMCDAHVQCYYEFSMYYRRNNA